MSRTKKMSDIELLSKAFDVISREGFESFTFEQVAKTVGLSPAGLVKRFKTKKNLARLARNVRWDQNLSSMDTPEMNSLTGLKGIFEFIKKIACSVDSKKLGEHARWLGSEACEARSRRQVANYFEVTRKIFKRLLTEAIKNGEISSRLEPASFSKTLEALVQGGIFQFAFLDERNIETHLRNHIQVLLEPYVLKK